MKSVQGCDSIYNVATISVNIIVTTTNPISLSGCNSVLYKGITYTSSTIVRDTVKSVQGCDSIYNIANISVNKIVTTINPIPLSGCNSVLYKGITYTSSTTVRDTVKSVQGCDSIYNVANISVNKIVATTNPIPLSGCNSVLFKGITYTSSTIVRDTVKSVQGCDSIYNVANITVTTPSIPSVVLSSTSVVANGKPVTFTATATNGGTSTTYIFKVNSVVMQSGLSNTYTSSTLNIGDSVTCYIISNETCITTTNASSSAIIMTTNFPLTLLSFQATIAGTNTNCIWQTTAEENTAYFNVQRSLDGNIFKDISKLKAAGNATTINDYIYIDENITDLNVFVLYYRLQMFDNDGHFTYSKVVKVIQSVPVKFNVFPNPAKGFVHVTGKNINTIKITDIDGKILILKSDIINDNSLINVNNISKGVYIIKVQFLSGNETAEKLLIE